MHMLHDISQNNELLEISIENQLEIKMCFVFNVKAYYCEEFLATLTL